MRVSHGCIQLYPEDIAALFSMVPVGTVVHLVNRPYIVGRIEGHLYLEAHLPLKNDTDSPAGTLARLRQAVLKAGANPVEVDWNRALAVAEAAQGIPLPIYREAPPVEAVLAAAPLVEPPLMMGLADTMSANCSYLPDFAGSSSTC
jgi:L,D-transpeptidase ErfK/SrfK